MNTVSRTKTLLISAMLPLIAAPVLGHAETTAKADAAAAACAKAFVGTSFTKDRPYTLITKDTQGFDPEASKYQIALTAKSKVSGKKLAKATCVVDHDGIALTVNGKSATVVAGSALLSAR